MTSPHDRPDLAPSDSAIVHILEVRERLVRMETKIDGFADTAKTAASASALAERHEREISDIKSDIARLEVQGNASESCSQSNRDDIIELKDNNRWMFRTGVGVGLVAIVNLIINLLQ